MDGDFVADIKNFLTTPGQKRTCLQSFISGMNPENTLTKADMEKVVGAISAVMQVTGVSLQYFAANAYNSALNNINRLASVALAGSTASVPLRSSIVRGFASTAAKLSQAGEAISAEAVTGEVSLVAFDALLYNALRH